MLAIKHATEKLKSLGCQRSHPMPALNEADFVAIEKSLKTVLPPSYRYFLFNARDYGLHFEEFLWPGTDCDLLETNFEERLEGLPDFLVSFLSDGYGTQVCFDTRFRNAHGEYPVIEWERGMHESNLSDQPLEPIAEDFPSWLIDTLEHEIEEQRDIDND